MCIIISGDAVDSGIQLILRENVVTISRTQTSLTPLFDQ